MRALGAFLRQFAILAAGLALALATAELAMRQYAFTQPDKGAKPWHREGGATSHWQNAIRLPASLDTQRKVLVLGDSFTAAIQVEDDETFCFFAERLLRARGHDVAILNAGNPGASIAEHILVAPKLLGQLRPAWTLVVLTDDDLGASAWSKANAHFQWQGAELGVVVPPDPHGRLKNAMKPLRRHSAALQNAYLQHKGLREMTGAWRPFQAGAAPKAKRAPSEKEFPVEEELKLASRVLEGRVTFVHLGLDANGITPMEARFRSACRELGLRCLTTREALDALRRRGVAPQGFPNSGWDVGHLNPWGHRAVAELLAQTLVAQVADGLL